MKNLYVLLLLFASTTAITFNCEFREVNWLALGMNYQCHTRAIFEIESSQYVTSIAGVHLSNKNINDVTTIHIDNCTRLSYIPKGLLQVFPNLVGIYLEGCGVSSLIGTELNEYPKLTLFALELSPLDYVPGNLFEQTPDMVLISFADNKINGTGINLLNNLNKLSQAYFEANVCVDKNAPTMGEIPGLNKTLNCDCTEMILDSDYCSIANEMYKSINFILLLCGLAYIGKYNWN